MRRAPTLAVVAVLYSTALALILLWPTPVDATLVTWAPRAPLAYVLLETVANVVLFVPFGGLLALLAPRVSVPVVALVGCAVSLLAESTQWAVRPERFATVSDVVANTLGAAGGALLARRLTRRSERPTPRG